VARRIMVASVLLSTLFGTAAKPVRAQELDRVNEDTIAAANEAGVTLTDLLGAMSATQLPARAYLIGVGELSPTPPSPSSTAAALPALTPPLGAAVARARCIIGKESGGADVPNRQGSGATGPGQYFPSSWARHTALYRAATGYSGGLSLHSYTDVLAVMSWILAAMPSTRAEWSVGGC
jgi:hypothetical protein